jgi:tetratricopeptide (TPR) repeat protein
MTLLIAVLLVSGLTATAQKQYSVFNGETEQANQPPIEAQEEQMSPVERYIDEIRRCPSCPELRFRLGKAHFESGSRRDAMEAFQEAVRLKPDYAEAYNGLGWATQTFFVCGNAGKISPPPVEAFEEAITAHQRALQLKPGYADAYRGIGWAHFALKQYSAAAAADEEAVRLDPDSGDSFDESFRLATFSRLAACYEELNRFEDAVSTYKESIRRASDYNLDELADQKFADKKFRFLDDSMKLALIYRTMGRHKESVDAYLQIISQEPDNWSAHFQLCLTYLALENRQAALAECDRLTTLLNRQLEDVDDQEFEEHERSQFKERIARVYGEQVRDLSKKIRGL